MNPKEGPHKPHQGTQLRDATSTGLGAGLATPFLGERGWDCSGALLLLQPILSLVQGKAAKCEPPRMSLLGTAIIWERLKNHL